MDSSSLAHEKTPHPDLIALLEDQGIEGIIINGEAELDTMGSESLPQLVLLDVSSMPEAELRRCVQRCSQSKIPVLALVPEERMAELDVALGVSDFVLNPPNPVELVARAKHILWRNAPVEGSNVIRIGDLTINPTSYEVSLKGRRINLRFKEYELLRLLASNPGRVYSREALLSRIWGYDYFGGTRTVDVHIRRLRSKIEDADHSFIETIWNVGYRFRDVGQSS